MKLVDIKAEKESIISQINYVDKKSKDLDDIILEKEEEIQEKLEGQLELVLDYNDRTHLNEISANGLKSPEGLIIEFVLDNLRFKYHENSDELHIEYDYHCGNEFTTIDITDTVINNLKAQIKKILKKL